MKIAVLFLALIGQFAPARTGDHLEPERGLFTEYEGYYNDIRVFFDGVEKGRVVCQVTILGTYNFVQFVAVCQTDKGHEVISIEPASQREISLEQLAFFLGIRSEQSCGTVGQIWDLELVRKYESGEWKSVDDEGNPVPLDQNEEYQKLKKRAPADVRHLRSEVKRAVINAALAQRIAKVWERMILGTRYPDEPISGFDGTHYHFSMPAGQHGNIDGKIWSPAENSKTGALVELAEALAEFAGRDMEVAKLKDILERVERATQR